MDNRIFEADAIATPPTAPASPSAGYPTNGNPLTAQNATEIGDWWFHQLGEEMRAVILEGGLTPDHTTLTQLRDAIKNIVKGGDYKASVRVASTAAINLAAPGANIDGIAMAAGDRFLEKDNATAADRGIYIWNGAAVPATRALDADNGAEFNGGAIIPVEEGTVNADTNWQVTNNGTVTIGTTGLTFAQVGAQQSVASIQGAFKNLQASSTGLSANVTVTADEIVVEDAANAYKTLRSVNLTIAGTSVGANGLDAGALAVSTWYSVWVISNGVTTAGLLSLSATAPTLPSGYTFAARIGWIRTDSTANKYPLSFIQRGRRVQYKTIAGSNVTVFPVAVSGVATFPAAVSTTSFIPSTAGKISITLQENGSVTGSQVSPNQVANKLVAANDYATTQGGVWLPCEFLLESTNFYYGSNSAQASVSITGWEDNI